MSELPELPEPPSMSMLASRADLRYTAEDMREYAGQAVAAEMERCAAIADDEARIREQAGLTHPEDSEARGRCFAGARAASNVARGIRAGEIVSAMKPPQ